MSELSFDTEVSEEVRPGQDSATLAMSAGEFAALEERVLRAINLVKRERMARAEADERAATAEALMNEQGSTIDNLQKEIASLRAEREAIKDRVDRIVAQLDTLEV
jgi:hypothetical protein